MEIEKSIDDTVPINASSELSTSRNLGVFHDVNDTLYASEFEGDPMMSSKGRFSMNIIASLVKYHSIFFKSNFFIFISWYIFLFIY